MFFSTVEIVPVDNEWCVYFSNLDGDRNDEDFGPHGLGFYHYPRKMGKKKAFEALKNLLIKNHIKKISEYTESLEKLHKLEMEGEI